MTQNKINRLSLFDVLYHNLNIDDYHIAAFLKGQQWSPIRHQHEHIVIVCANYSNFYYYIDLLRI